MEKIRDIFQTLSDLNRLKIIQLIGDKETSVGEIVKLMSLSQPLVSHHLRVLKKNGVLSTKREGPFIYYYISDIKILYAIHVFVEISNNNENINEQKLNFCPDWIIKKFNK